MARGDLAQSAFVDDVEPGAHRSLSEEILDVVPALHEPNQPVPGAEVALPANLKHAQAGLKYLSHFGWLRPDALVTSDDDQLAAGYDRNPVDVKHTYGTLGNQRMSRVDRVASCRRQGLTQAERALVNEEP